MGEFQYFCAKPFKKKEIMLDKEITFDRFVRGLIIIFGIVLAVVAINYLSSVLVPFIVAWFIAYLIFPLVLFFQNKCHLKYRIVSIIVTLLIIGGVIYGFVARSMPIQNTEIDQFSITATRFIKNGEHNQSIPPSVKRFVSEKAQ